jgi:hypothetical protein
MVLCTVHRSCCVACGSQHATMHADWLQCMLTGSLGACCTPLAPLWVSYSPAALLYLPCLQGVRGCSCSIMGAACVQRVIPPPFSPNAQNCKHAYLLRRCGPPQLLSRALQAGMAPPGRHAELGLRQLAHMLLCSCSVALVAFRLALQVFPALHQKVTAVWAAAPFVIAHV